MKKLLTLLIVATLAMGCQSESLDMHAPYRIKLNAGWPGQMLKQHQPYGLPLELLTDSYYSKFGYDLVYYQQTGLGRLVRGVDSEQLPVLQNVPVNIPLGRSDWWFVPEAIGPCQVVLVAQQSRGYTQPDTVRLNFQIVP